MNEINDSQTDQINGLNFNNPSTESENITEQELRDAGLITRPKSTKPVPDLNNNLTETYEDIMPKKHFSVSLCNNIEWHCELLERGRYSQYLTDGNGRHISEGFEGPTAPWVYKKGRNEEFKRILEEQHVPPDDIKTLMINAANELKDEIDVVTLVKIMSTDGEDLSSAERRINEIRSIAEKFKNESLKYNEDKNALFNCGGRNYVKFRRCIVKEINGEQKYVLSPYTIMELIPGNYNNPSKFAVYLKENIEINYGLQINSIEIKEIIAYLLRYSMENEQIMVRRIAQIDNTIYYDMCDKDNSVIIIKNGGWKIQKDNEEIIFIREKHQLPQVTPVPGGDYNKLRRFLPFKNEDDKTLFLMKICADFAVNQNRQHITIYGLPDTGKTATSIINQDLFDPNTTPEGDAIDDSIEVNVCVLRASKRPLVSFDNCTNIKKPINNVLCQFSTGYTASPRAYYTQDDELLRSFKSSVILTATNITGMLPDLKSRMLMFETYIDLDSDTWNEDDYKREWEEERPEIFGGLLDIVAAAQEIVKDLKLRLPQSVRMTGFAKWVYACGEIMTINGQKIGGENALNMYKRKLLENNLDLFEENPLSKLIYDYLSTLPQDTPIEKTATEFYNEIRNWANALKIALDTNFPKNPQSFMRRFKPLIPALHTVNIIINTKRAERATMVYIKNKNPPIAIPIPKAGPLIYSDGTTSANDPPLKLGGIQKT